ncbi:MAG TPA: ABC transporter permease [Ohtaekwangia sp.]|nr:ABC transporter permease [Ohtaekwangia sp.]
MNKTWLIFQREFLNRVQKKSFLIATILVPLIFPAILAVMVYVFMKQEESAVKQTIEVYDATGKMQFEEDDKYKFIPVTGNLDQLKTAFNLSDHYALLYIPEIELANPEGITLYTKENLSILRMEQLKGKIEDLIHGLKLEQFNISRETLSSLKTNIRLHNINISDPEEEKENNTQSLYALGFILGMLIYFFVMIYGMQIMLGVIDEKTSKVVEVIISSVRPFQLMLGKILGIAAVGLLQFTIWAVLISVLSSATLGLLGVDMADQQTMEQVQSMQQPDAQVQANNNNPVVEIVKIIDKIPILYITFNFIFYFLGGYLLYGALFAAVGSAVDNQQEAQQFTLPIMMPLLISYFALFMFILTDPHSTASFWFSIIPFTSPIAMVGRLGFDVPLWELLLSQVLLIAGFIFTTWIAGRVYRIGILMHGSKVNYKVLAKWFMMKA